MGKYHKRCLGLKKFISLAVAAAMAFSFALPVQAQPSVNHNDVSHWQDADGLPLSYYQTIKRGGVDGVAVKATDDDDWTDPAAAVNFQNAKTAGLVTSLYCYMRPTSTSSARSEAKYLVKTAKKFGMSKTADGVLIGDIEQTTLTHSKSALTNYVNAFIDEIENEGYVAAIYTGDYYLKNRLYGSKLHVAGDRLWIARYSSNEPSWVGQKGAWQFSSSYNLAGHRVDVSHDYSGWLTNYASHATAHKVAGKIKTVSLVNYLKSKGANTSFNYRTTLAYAYGIVTKKSLYKGTAAQNIALVARLKQIGFTSKTKIPTVKKTSTKSAAKETVIKIGSRGAAVKTMQSKLASVYYYPQKSARNHGVDGIFGARTANAVKRFQLTHGLTADGIYGPRTSAALSKATAKRSVKSSVRTYTVHRGDTLWGIAKAKGTTVGKLKSKNGIKSDIIYPGQKIKY